MRNIVDHCSTFLRPYGVTVEAKFESPDSKQEDTEHTEPGPSHTQPEPMHEEARPTPSDDDVAKVTDQLKSMGFDDEGGWLSELVRSRGADVDKVLEVLHWEQ